METTERKDTRSVNLRQIRKIEKRRGRTIDAKGKLKGILLKKAVGFEKSETIKEYQVDEAGNETLIRKKVQKKYFPPDLQAMRAYLELERGTPLEAMTDEELEAEKERLLAELCEKRKRREKH